MSMTNKEIRSYIESDLIDHAARAMRKRAIELMETTDWPQSTIVHQCDLLVDKVRGVHRDVVR